jgi:hypothetical protein
MKPVPAIEPPIRFSRLRHQPGQNPIPVPEQMNIRRIVNIALTDRTVQPQGCSADLIVSECMLQQKFIDALPRLGSDALQRIAEKREVRYFPKAYPAKITQKITVCHTDYRLAVRLCLNPFYYSQPKYLLAGKLRFSATFAAKSRKILVKSIQNLRGAAQNMVYSIVLSSMVVYYFQRTGYVQEKAGFCLDFLSQGRPPFYYSLATII